MSSANIPLILAVAIDGSHQRNVIEGILGTEGISTVSEKKNLAVDECPICRINTKYYTANVQFRPLLSKTESTDSIVDNVEALILYLDHSIGSLTKELDDWNPALRDIDTDAKILLSTNSIPEDQKEAVDAWCRENKYELIELGHNDDSTTDSSIPNFSEKFGIERLVEILQTHQWSNLTEKMIINVSESLASEFKTPEYRDFFVPRNTPSKTPPEGLDPYREEDFYSLFQNLKSMKANMSSMSQTERLDEAEKVVKIFWTAISGDSNEFSDSDYEA